MIPNHDRFIEAIHGRLLASVRYYSRTDGSVVERILAPVDYGPRVEYVDGLSRFRFWDLGEDVAPHAVSLLPQEIVDLHLLGRVFDPARVTERPAQWSVPRKWTA
jgi:hypothetical protein